MSNIVLIIVCVLLLIAYLFDLVSSRIKIPSVLLLLSLGIFLRELIQRFEIFVPDLTFLLPVLGTLGLLLIVLDGSLELELSKSKKKLIINSLLGSFLSVLALVVGVGFAFYVLTDVDLTNAMYNAVPLAIISSAVAISAAVNLEKSHKEFVVYESSFSDIFGILFFTFFSLNEIISFMSFVHLSFQILIILLASVVATVILAILLRIIHYRVKFIPIIIFIVLLYAVSKVFHLPGLLFILFFGLTLGNIEKLRNFRWIKPYDINVLKTEIVRFKELVTEITFLVRTVFFLLFGFTITLDELFNLDSLYWSLGIFAGIYVIRFFQIRISRLPVIPLLFFAPRGLINILLFLSIDPQRQISLVNQSVIIQIVMLTALFLMFGTLLVGKNRSKLKS